MAQYTALQLPPGAWILRHQAEDALFRRVMPPWWWLATILPAVSAFVNRSRSRNVFLLSAIAVGAAMAVTIAHEVPINRIVQHWSAANPPAEVDALRHSWIKGHLVRTILSSLGFVLSVLGLMDSRRAAQGFGAQA